MQTSHTSPTLLLKSGAWTTWRMVLSSQLKYPKFSSAWYLYLKISMPISYERAVKRTKPKSNYKPCVAECYPNNQEHTMENQYEADTKRDRTEDKKCEKSYNSKATITGGLTHLSCQHGIVKGFTALQRGESPLLIVGPALRRLPSRVKANRRFFIYD